jgi:hypothetical protein
MSKQRTHDISRNAKRSKVNGQHNESSPEILGLINTTNPVRAGAAGQGDALFEKRKPIFEHQPLDLDADSIRVLEIIPGSEQAIIQCKMRSTLIEEEEYVCLSYTWEPKNPFHEIEIDGKICTVGENLWQFLHTARSAGIKEPLWVDALCINQSNHPEKNHQVSLMSEIYTKSQKALIWLGDTSMDDMLKDFLREIVKYGEALSQ